MKPIPMWRRFDRLFGADRASDVRDELRFHIEAKTDDLIARGWKPEQARREAERQFGDVLAVQRMGEHLGGKMDRRKGLKDYWADAARDLRYAIRMLSKSRSLPWRSESAPTPPFSAPSTPSCSALFRLRISSTWSFSAGPPAMTQNSGGKATMAIAVMGTTVLFRRRSSRPRMRRPMYFPAWPHLPGRWR